MESNRKLLSSEREQLILQHLGTSGNSIVELSRDLGVSEATIRRDLLSLEEQKRIRRVHGGAVRVKFPRNEPIFREKEILNAAEKRKIAKLALSYIKTRDTIYLDGGSTVLGLAKLLASSNGLTIVTNSLMAAAELMESGHKLILVGGEFRPLSRTIVGPLTATTLDKLSIDKAFLGTIGFTIEDGISTTDANEAYTKELVLQRARKVILMTDSSKLGTPSFAVSGKISDLDVLITDQGISAKFAKALKKKKITVVN